MVTVPQYGVTGHGDREKGSPSPRLRLDLKREEPPGLPG